MAVQAQHMTLEEFKQFAALPENADRLFEYIGGESVEVVCHSYSSLVAATILFLIKLYLRENGLWAYVTGEAAGYMVAGESYIPDVGVLSKTRHAEPPRETWIPIPPDLAVEVLSPTDKPKEISVKVVNYLAVGTTVWIVDPESEVIKICVPGQKVKTVSTDGTLDGGDVLPGFSVTVKDIFQV